MNYELAKKLKDAGWKSLQEISDYSLEYEANQITLSELIEACGDEFGVLVNNKELGQKAPKGREWVAESFSKEGIGSAPEEAVANLWLELKDNNKII